MRIEFKKALVVFSFIFALIIIFVFLSYFAILPNLIKSKLVLNTLEKTVKKDFGADLKIENPILDVKFKPEVSFKIDNISLSKKDVKIFYLDEFDLKINFKNIFKKEIEIKKLNAKDSYISINNIASLLPSSNSDKNTNQKFDWNINFLNSDLSLKNINVEYQQNKNLINLLISDINLQNNYLNLNLNANILKEKQNIIKIKTNIKENILLTQQEIIINSLKTYINNSDVEISGKLNQKDIHINAKSKRFYLTDIFNLINSNLIIPQGNTMLSPLKDPKGNVSFNISLNNSDLSGIINVNNTGIKIKDVSNIPINVTKGKIKISKDKIFFDKLIGYYGKSKTNKIEITGDIKDYYKSFDSNIEIESIITNEFFKDYLASLINNTELYVSKPSRTKIIYKSKNNIMDIIWFAQIDKTVDFGITTEKSALSDYDRAVLAQIQINDNKIDIKNMNYYIASNIVKGVKLQPILQMNALMDFQGKIDNAGLAFGREMPCEFLNVFIGQKLFKKGTIKGNINVAFKNNIPYLDADMEIKKTLIPSSRTYIREAKIKTSNNLIELNTQGKFKRADFNFEGKIKNGLKAPYIIKNLNLDLDNIDIERILASFNNQETAKKEIEIENENEISDDNYMFDTNLIRIEDCNFTLKNGKYKDLTFGNIDADLTLDEKGILKIKSNKFDIAQGISTLKVECDLNKLKYYIKLGAKEIDSNLMTKTLFNLDKEITGRASGIIELFGDKSLKMNGDIKFLINDGTIGKIGLVEYLMKIASVFRNPIVMVSPVTIMDIISIPEGKFDKIEGKIKIKDNVLAPIDIKSYSKTLSALIKGKFDLERHDASMRIYTRFSTDKKSMLGILRNLSLSSLANKMNINNNDASYYESEISQLPQIEVNESKTQIFLTQIEGDIEHFNFLSSLKKIK